MAISFMVQEKNEFENCHLKYSRSALNKQKVVQKHILNRNKQILQQFGYLLDVKFAYTCADLDAQQQFDKRPFKIRREHSGYE